MVELVAQRTARLRDRVRELSEEDDLTPRELLHGVLTLWSDQPGELPADVGHGPPCSPTRRSRRSA